MANSKISMLKDMKINEISLVTDPACPGAVVLFTKHRAPLADAVFSKFDPEQPRDDHGRWTQWAGAARAHVQALSNHAKALGAKVAENQFYQAARDKVGATAGNVARNTASVIRTTRARGARPVVGGGVQFDFEHGFTNGTKLVTSVQIRPEHISALDKVIRGENGLELQRAPPLQRALSAVHAVLVRGGFPEQPSFEGERPGWFGYRHMDATDLDIERASRVRDAENRKKASGLFATVLGTNSSSTNPNAQGVSRPPPAQTSTERTEVSIRDRAPGAVPEYRAPTETPTWAREAHALRPVGHSQKDENGFPVPLPGAHSPRSAGGQPYYMSTGEFVPGGRPDIQESIEQVHNWVGASAENRAIRDRSAARNLMPSNADGRAHFSPEGWYIPAGPANLQNQYRSRYQNEADRIEEENFKSQRTSTAPKNLFAADPHVAAGRDLLKEADDDLARHLTKGRVTRVPMMKARGSDSGSLRWNLGPPRVAQNLFH